MAAQMTEKIVGILGGMGPEATIDLMRRIMQLTPAKDDVDHIHCIVDNNPKVPSRIQAIIDGTGESPAACMAGMAQRLEASGADFIVIPCNTAHHYHRDVQESVRVPVLNLIELTVEFVLRAVPGVGKVGLLASPAVRITGLYENLFRPRGVEVIYPAAADEERLFRLIKEIKAGASGENVRRDFVEIVLGLSERGAEVGIIACTELSAVNEGDFPMFVYDASDILARKIIDMVKNNDECLS
jgi:aspartate racemase